MRTVALVLSLVLCIALAPAVVHADLIEGEARVRGHLVAPTIHDVDGLGTCRMIVLFDRYNVIDFPVGTLADDCESFGLLQVGAYVEMYVTDAPPIPCDIDSCSKTSAMSHFVATSTVQ